MNSVDYPVRLLPVNLRLGFLVFFSGAAALIYQTLWVKQLSLVVGADVYAITIGVAAFFAGLALGSLYFGKISDRVSNPLLLFARLEGGIALLGLTTTLLLSRSAALFVLLRESLGILAWMLPFLLVGVPAFLMGGTLPALLRTIAPDDKRLGKASGNLYAANTTGAIGGTLATVFRHPHLRYHWRRSCRCRDEPDRLLSFTALCAREKNRAAAP